MDNGQLSHKQSIAVFSQTCLPNALPSSHPDECKNESNPQQGQADIVQMFFAFLVGI